MTALNAIAISLLQNCSNCFNVLNLQICGVLKLLKTLYIGCYKIVMSIWGYSYTYCITRNYGWCCINTISYLVVEMKYTVTKFSIQYSASIIINYLTLLVSKITNST